MTMIRPRSDVVYGIYRGLPSGFVPHQMQFTESVEGYRVARDVVYGICRGLPSGTNRPRLAEWDESAEAFRVDLGRII